MQLLDKVSHEPVGVGASVEPLVALALHIDLNRLRLDLRDVLTGSAMRADFVAGCGKERHWHLLDLTHINKGCLFLPSKPVFGKLLEPVSEAVHHPVLL